VRLLDLFAGPGGASVGYARAGFEVVGVDTHRWREYPFEVVQADALEYLAAHGHEFDAIHASPPCQAYSVRAVAQRNQGREYPDLLAPTRDALVALGKPWVIENVPGAPMRADYVLCGCFFGLGVRRERWFEASWEPFNLRPAHDHSAPAITVTGSGSASGTRRADRGVIMYDTLEVRAAMGIDWATRRGLSQAIPPRYTELIGHDLRAELLSQTAAPGASIR
jgi:DNA (cytosine-5)-methyltransferase 1